MLFLLVASTVDVLAITYVMGMSLVTCTIAVFKGRSLVLWTAGCLLFPPLLYWLVKKPATSRAGKIVCPYCDRWTRADPRCEHCRYEIDYSSFVE